MGAGSRGSAAHGKGQGPYMTPKLGRSHAEREAELLELEYRDDAAGNRVDIMKMLDRREQDAEELELESCFSELKQKAGAGASKDVD